MDKYFEELPHARQIQRSDFDGATFDSGTFLLQFHEFQKLQDLQSQLKRWESQLAQELTDIVNQDYPQLVGLSESLETGAQQLSDIKSDVEQYRQEIVHTHRDLEQTTANVRHMTEHKRQLARQKSKATAIVRYLSMVDDLDAQMGYLDTLGDELDGGQGMGQEMGHKTGDETGHTDHKTGDKTGDETGQETSDHTDHTDHKADHTDHTLIACEWLARVVATKSHLEGLWPQQAAVVASGGQVARLRARLQGHAERALKTARGARVLDLHMAKRELLDTRS